AHLRFGGRGRGLRRGRAGRLAAEPGGDPVPHVVHVEAARVALPVGPLQVPDDGLGTPAVVTADGCGDALDGLELGGGPGVVAVAEVDALEAVEAGVAVDG